MFCCVRPPLVREENEFADSRMEPVKPTKSAINNNKAVAVFVVESTMDGLTAAEVEKHMSESKTEKCEPLKPAQGSAQVQQQLDSQLGAGAEQQQLESDDPWCCWGPWWCELSTEEAMCLICPDAGAGEQQEEEAWWCELSTAEVLALVNPDGVLDLNRRTRMRTNETHYEDALEESDTLSDFEDVEEGTESDFFSCLQQQQQREQEQQDGVQLLAFGDVQQLLPEDVTGLELASGISAIGAAWCSETTAEEVVAVVSPRHVKAYMKEQQKITVKACPEMSTEELVAVINCHGDDYPTECDS